MQSGNSMDELNIGIIGGGIGGMSAAIALRRAGHYVTIYEKGDFVGETGGSISCAANGTRWLNNWDVDVSKGDGVVLRKLISRHFSNGVPLSVYDLDDYEQRWGHVHYMFLRKNMHSMLKDCAIGDGKGVPVQILVNHNVRMPTATQAYAR